MSYERAAFYKFARMDGFVLRHFGCAAERELGNCFCWEASGNYVITKIMLCMLTDRGHLHTHTHTQTATL